MLDSLRRGDERGVENRFVLDLAGHILGLVDDAVDGGTIHHLGLFAMQPEDLFHTHHVVFGLAQMRLEILLELRIACLLDHLWQGLHDLLLGVIDVAQRVHEQIVHGFDVFREEAHAFLLVSFLCLLGCDSMRRRLRHHALVWQRVKGRSVPVVSIAPQSSRRFWNLQNEGKSSAVRLVQTAKQPNQTTIGNGVLTGRGRRP